MKVEEKACTPVCPANISMPTPSKKDDKRSNQREVLYGNKSTNHI